MQKQIKTGDFGFYLFDNWAKIKYVMRHKVAFVKTQKKLCGRITLAGIFHDMDKLFLLPFMNRHLVGMLHQRYADHHVGNGKPITKKRLTLSIIDYECARLTKPDKPQTAREFIYSSKKEYIFYFEPILKELGL